MQFNETQLRQKLKKELGFADIPDEELKNHQIQLNSPTGRSNSLSLSVAAYIDAEVDLTRQSYIDLGLMMESVESPIITGTQEYILTGDTTTSKLEVNNIKYYDISYGKDDQIHNYTVAIGFNPQDVDSVQNLKEQSDLIKSHFTFVKERTRDQLLGFETIISYYQYVNLVSALVNPNPLFGDNLTESIAARLSTIFEGVEDIDMIRKQFSL